MPMNINDTFIACADKWSKQELDERINFALDNFDEWISNYDKEGKDLLVKLLQDFDYYSYNLMILSHKEMNIKDWEACECFSIFTIMNLVIS